MNKKRVIVAAAGCCAVVLIGGAAYAVIPDSNGVIHACYSKTGGALRVSDTGPGRTSRSRRDTRRGTGEWPRRGLPRPGAEPDPGQRRHVGDSPRAGHLLRGA